MARARRHDSSTLQCSFCHEPQDAVDKLISSPSDYPRAYICDRCILLCGSVLREAPDVRHPLLDGMHLIKGRERVRGGEALGCSFCHKTLGTVEGLISGPSDTSPGIYICEECIAVCEAIVNDSKPPVAGPFDPNIQPSNDVQALLDRPLTVPLLSAIEHWIRHESLGVDANRELDAVREIARLWATGGP